MTDIAQLGTNIDQLRNLFVGEALATVQQVQTGVRQIQTQQQPVAVQENTGRGSGLVWFALGTIAALIAMYYWRQSREN